jgi:hypothetical protein
LRDLRDLRALGLQWCRVFERSRVQGSGFRVQGSGFRVQGSGFRVQGSGFSVQGSWFQSSRFMVSGFGV